MSAAILTSFCNRSRSLCGISSDGTRMLTPAATRPLFTEFVPQLLTSHPTEVRAAHAPLIAVFTELMGAAHAAGRLRDGTDPGLMAAMTMQTVILSAQPFAGPMGGDAPALTGREVWNYCASGFAATAP